MSSQCERTVTLCVCVCGGVLVYVGVYVFWGEGTKVKEGQVGTPATLRFVGWSEGTTRGEASQGPGALPNTNDQKLLGHLTVIWISQKVDNKRGQPFSGTEKQGKWGGFSILNL